MSDATTPGDIPAPGELPGPGDLPVPPITDEMRELARQQPGSWLYSIDPFFEDGADENAEVPPFGIVGAYQVDDAGIIDPKFVPNPNYRPSPVALDFPDPTNDIEIALGLAATGYGGDEQLRDILLAGTVITQRGQDDDSVLIIDEGQDRDVVRAYSSAQYLPGGYATERSWHLPVRALLPALRGRYLSLNPESRIGVRIPGEALGA